MTNDHAKVDYSKNRLLHTLLATVFCWICIFLAGPIVSVILHPVEKFNPLSRWQDVQLSDLYFSYFSAAKRQDTSVVIMDCSNEDRNGIASQIETAIDNGAKVVGLDVQFGANADTSGTARLREVLTLYSKKVVLAIDHLEEGKSKMNEPFYLDLMTAENPNPNFGYLSLTDPHKVMRYFTPFIHSHEKSGYDTSFAVKIMQLYGDNEAWQKLNKRKRKVELVHYHNFEGYEHTELSRYPVIGSWTDVAPGALAGKIVLIGDYNIKSFDDYHFSPLNKSLQRPYPDLKGVEFHAQVISMIKNGDYLSGLWFRKGWIFLFCAAGIFFFLKLLHKSLFHIYLDIIVLCMSPVIMAVSIIFLKYCAIKIEPSDFIIPLFFSGIFLHLYDYLINRKWARPLVERMQKNK